MLYRGTAFPDIRRMAGLVREATHRYDVTYAEIEAEHDSWRVGWLLHSYLDVAWNTYFQKQGMISINPKDELRWLAVKITEEVREFDALADRAEVAKAFLLPATPQERASGADPGSIAKWNSFIYWKLDERFNFTDWERHSVAAGYSDEETAQLKGFLTQTLHSQLWRRRLDKLHQSLGY
jgi:hypothetical protein